MWIRSPGIVYLRPLLRVLYAETKVLAWVVILSEGWGSLLQAHWWSAGFISLWLCDYGPPLLTSCWLGTNSHILHTTIPCCLIPCSYNMFSIRPTRECLPNTWPSFKRFTWLGQAYLGISLLINSSQLMSNIITGVIQHCIHWF